MTLFVEIEKSLPGFKLKVRFDTNRDVMGLLGSSGSGKSMTLRCIAGIDKPDKGKIILNGRVLFDSNQGINVPSKDRKVGYLFQNYALFPNMTVEENIGFGLKKLTKEKRKAIIEEKITMLKLKGLEKRFPFQLSGGQQQRVALARALAIEPEVLLLDEPFSALDNHLRNILVKQLIDTLYQYQGVTLFVTHNMEEAYKICNSLVILQDGSVETYGRKEEIFNKPPTLATAQLTGCKNFSDAQYVSPNQLIALDWGIKLYTNHNIEESLKYVGIRSHCLRQALDNEKENVLKCWPSFISETPFGITVYLSVGNKPQKSEDYHLEWEITKEKWLEIKEQALPWTLCLQSENLLTFDK
ncbi:MAG: sulfate/molybdate ABC transporter ATP-binding protein [Peptococcales bacterium]|jgi:ABC-type sulfate/molybdate transport systems ATPase subunit